eukprot:7143170-Prymnesium_polylepis.1
MAPADSIEARLAEQATGPEARARRGGSTDAVSVSRNFRSCETSETDTILLGIPTTSLLRQEP